MLNQVQSQKQGLKINPSQIQLLNFFQMNSQQLEQHIKNMMVENPMLEEVETDTDSDKDFDAKDDRTQDFMDWEEFREDDVADYKTRVNNYSDDTTGYLPVISEQVSWREELKLQFHSLLQTEHEQVLADYLVDSLTDKGYLTGSAESLADDVSFSYSIFVEEDEMLRLVDMLKRMNPAGIGTNSLQECLLVQLQRKAHTELAQTVVAEYFDELSSHNYDRIVKKGQLSEQQLKEVLLQIAGLNPAPIVGAAASNTEIKDTIIPDYIIHTEGEFVDISLNTKGIPPLKVNANYLQELAGSKATNSYLASKINAANWLIDAIQQREHTMMKTIRAICNIQKEYFLTGEKRLLKPMVLREIAELIKMDISTVSRVTSGKYAQTPFGLIHLKELFTEAIKSEQGEDVSNKQIQYLIEELIEAEDKHQPLNDFEIKEELLKKGINIARRTVAKYREILDVPAAQMRKIL